MRLMCAGLASMRFPCLPSVSFVRSPLAEPRHSRLGRLAAGLPCRRWFGAALRASRVLSTRVCVFCQQTFLGRVVKDVPSSGGNVATTATAVLVRGGDSSPQLLGPDVKGPPSPSPSCSLALEMSDAGRAVRSVFFAAGPGLDRGRAAQPKLSWGAEGAGSGGGGTVGVNDIDVGSSAVAPTRTQRPSLRPPLPPAAASSTRRDPAAQPRLICPQ